ncbi:g11773 [Coccomyxa elongata]
MAAEFSIPAKPEDLADEDCVLEVKICRLTALENLAASAVEGFAEGALYDICNQDALCIVEQDILDKIYSLTRGFSALSSIARKRLVDGLCSNLSVLGLSIGALVSAQDQDDASDNESAASSHRSGLAAYIFLLTWLARLAEDEAKAAADTTDTGAGGKSRGRKKAAAPHAMLQWDWDGQRDKIARALAVIADIDLWKLFRPRSPDERLLQTWTQSAQLLLESAAAMKSKTARDGAFAVLTACALKYGQLEAVAGAAVAALTRNEHMAVALAELAEYSQAKYDDSRLGVEMLAEVAAVSPQEYERQQKDDLASSGGVRNTAKFVEALADRCPRLVAANVSMLIGHLGGKAYSLRSAIITALGHLVHKAFEHTPGEDADAQGARARLRSKHALLATLMERVRDSNAYTRARVLQTWSHLAEISCIPLGHWNAVTKLAIGRLEDKSSIVRRAALQLLMALLLFNPFGAQLPEACFAASLAEYKAKLQELDPQPEKAPEDAAFGDAGKAGEDAAPMEEEAASGSGAEADVEQAEIRLADARNGDPVGGNVTQMRALVASLEAAVAFVRALAAAVPVLTQLLASSTVSDVHDAIGLLISYSKFGIDGAPAALRKMLPLVFSLDQAIKDAVINAVEELYISNRPPQEAAQCLIDLTHGSNLGELSALEEVVAHLIRHQTQPLLKPITLRALWWLCERAHRAALSPASTEAAGDAAAETGRDHAQEVRGAMLLISMAAAVQPDMVADHLDTLLQVGFNVKRPDPLTARSACMALRHLAAAAARPAEARLRPAYVALAAAITGVGPAGAADGGWYTVAEAAVTALYALHPQPSALCEAALRHLALEALTPAGVPGGPAEEDASSKHGSDTVSAVALSRFFFVLGQVALQHLVYVEQTAKQIRREVAAKEKAIAEARSERLAAGEGPSQESQAEDDIAEQLGVGGAAADAELDRLKDCTEAEIMARTGLIGRFAPLVAEFCVRRNLRSAHTTLRASALLALTKLMCLDASFCDHNLQLIFTLLKNREIEAAERSNLIIAVGDLTFRFPNLLEPWTAHIYQPLSDPDPGMRKNCLMVLSHLILNDMMKVKGHIARLALCLQDDDPRIAGLAQVFFHELSRKASKTTNPIYNLLPDILSSLSAEPGLPSAHFQAIMRTLLGYIGKEKHADSLVEKLMLRFEAASDAAQWRNLAFCLTQLNFTEKGLRKMMEMSKSYRQSLGCEEILDTFKAIFAKARKLQKQTPELKADLEAFESKLDAEAAEVAEEEAVAAAARSHAADGRPAESVDATKPIDTADSGGRMDAEARVEDTGSAAELGEVGAAEGHAARHEDWSQASDSLLGGAADSAHSAAAPLTQTPDDEAVSDLGDVLAGLALDKQADSGAPAEQGSTVPANLPALDAMQAASIADAAAIADELARLALAQPPSAAGAPTADPTAAAAAHPENADTQQPRRPREPSSSNAPQQEAPTVRLRAAHPSKPSSAADAVAPAAAPAGRRRSGRLSAAADQENRNSANAAAPADEGDAVVVKRERRGLGASAAEDASSGAAAQPSKGAAKRVMAMRKFWEETAQKEGRPRAGA